MALVEASKEAIREFVRTSLGHPTIGVELEDNHIDLATDQALRLFNRYFFKLEPHVVYEQYGDVAIDLGEDAQGVVDVKVMFPETQRIYAQMNIFEIMYRMVFPRLPIGQWYELRSFYEMYQRVRGTEPDWYLDEFSKKLYVDCWSGPYDVFYVVSKELDLTSLGNGKGMYWERFLEAALAYSKQILARIRGRFGDSVPAPGGMLASDASVLRDEARAEIEKTEAFLKSASRVFAPVFG